jgi:hypothetical protein
MTYRGRDAWLTAVITGFAKEGTASRLAEEILSLEIAKRRDKLRSLLQLLIDIDHEDAPTFAKVFLSWERANLSEKQEQMCEDWFKRACTLLANNVHSTLPSFSLLAWEDAASP